MTIRPHLVMPSVVDLWSYGEIGCDSPSAARVRERYRREAMMCAFLFWKVLQRY